MEKLVLASGNAKKLAEMQHLLAPLNIEVVAQSEFDVPEAEETGITFVENAIVKARNACKHTGLPAIADDSGLEVAALNGEFLGVAGGENEFFHGELQMWLAASI